MSYIEVLKRYVSLQVSHSLTQNKKERLTEVISPSTFCNQPFQRVYFTLPLANEDIGFVWFMLSLLELRTARSVCFCAWFH